jgi:hypothetical protein
MQITAFHFTHALPEEYDLALLRNGSRSRRYERVISLERGYMVSVAPMWYA